ncbi:hypothetical protein [Nocardia coubleae]|uniref:Bulb-type lectin domain-containing protein n=1 Tax=Nocardia coubleae TaxID=356147 RepID=A0A846W1A7_9NOCA|nr:hypothetical protein [Nocardia coubleae]NKX86546.1 hypothetical protein [Nocardia coubleae]
MKTSILALLGRIRVGNTVLALVASTLSVMAAVPGPAMAAPADSFTSADVGFAEGSGDGADIVRRLSAMQSAVSPKVPVLRLDLDWWSVEPARGAPLRWDRLDPVVDAAAARGMRVLLVLAYAPPWANGGHSGDKWFPTRDQDWTSIVDRTVAHFGGKVQAYEIWNEPNFVNFANFVGDRKARYWQLVKLAYPRVKARCPGCVVLAGASGAGTVQGGTNPNAPSVWLDWAYSRGYRNYFDAVAHHPYPAWNSGKGPADPECVNRWWNMFGPPSEAMPCGELALVHSVMVRHGDTAKKVWATEFGYPTAGLAAIPSASTVSEYLVQGVRMWRALPYAGPLIVYSYRDRCTAADDPECHFGLVTTTMASKEPITADVSAALRGDGVTPVPSWPERLAAGATLPRASALRSRNGLYELWLQGDGNLVLYRTSGEVLWSTATTNGENLVNQNDGNLVLYTGSGAAAWSSRTWTQGPSTLVLEDTGNLVLYRNDGGSITWSTGTAQG